MSKYRRLTGTRLRRQGGFSTFSTRSSLWLGDDHLLLVDSSGYSEDYKRFYFRDIQALVVSASNRRLALNLILGIPTVLCLGGFGFDMLSSSITTAGAVTGIIVTSVFAIPLLINNLFGPSCRCRIRTAVQTEELPSLSRVRRVAKVMERVRPLIVAAQGGLLAPAEVDARMRDFAAVSRSTSAAGESNLPPRIAS